MSLFIILTVIQAMIAAALVAVVLMQRSEGGGLGIGGNPSGALGARGAADFLTRSTKWLAVAFVTMSIVLAALAVSESSMGDVTTTLDRDVAAPDILGGDAGEGSNSSASVDVIGEGDGDSESSSDAQSDDPLGD